MAEIVFLSPRLQRVVGVLWVCGGANPPPLVVAVAEVAEVEAARGLPRQRSAYFNNQQDLQFIPGIQAFSTNSGSYVDDSASVRYTQAITTAKFTGHSIDSMNALPYSQRSIEALSVTINLRLQKMPLFPSTLTPTRKSPTPSNNEPKYNEELEIGGFQSYKLKTKYEANPTIRRPNS
nr:AP2-like ethylene-responsive transcription factor AIL6 [Ipomoea batatas]